RVPSVASSFQRWRPCEPSGWRKRINRCMSEPNRRSGHIGALGSFVDTTSKPLVRGGSDARRSRLEGSVAQGRRRASMAPSGGRTGAQEEQAFDSMDRFDKFTDRARKVLTLAQDEAQRFNHNYIGTEHL